MIIHLVKYSYLKYFYKDDKLIQGFERSCGFFSLLHRKLFYCRKKVIIREKKGVLILVMFRILCKLSFCFLIFKDFKQKQNELTIKK